MTLKDYQKLERNSVYNYGQLHKLIVDELLEQRKVIFAVNNSRNLTLDEISEAQEILLKWRREEKQ